MPARPAGRHHAPLRIAPDTFLIRQFLNEGTAPVTIPVNSLVITGSEPIIVDTGAPNNRAHWMDDVFSLVDPADVRWIFLSHDDVDHTGNLEEVLEACPRATLVWTFFTAERLSVEIDVPLARQRWVNDGGSFHVGDRTLVARRPPVYDSPTTRGLFDPTTGVYWASDAFAVGLPEAVDDVADVDADEWLGTMTAFSTMISPWIPLVDRRRWEESVGVVESLGARVLASTHSPVISGGRVAQALAALHDLPSAAVAPEPGQPDLEAMIAAAAA